MGYSSNGLRRRSDKAEKLVQLHYILPVKSPAFRSDGLGITCGDASHLLYNNRPIIHRLECPSDKRNVLGSTPSRTTKGVATLTSHHGWKLMPVPRLRPSS